MGILKNCHYLKQKTNKDNVNNISSFIKFCNKKYILKKKGIQKDKCNFCIP